MQAAALHSPLPGHFLVTETRRWLLEIHDSLVDVLDSPSAEEEEDHGKADKEPAGLEETPQAHLCEGDQLPAEGARVFGALLDCAADPALPDHDSAPV